MFPNIGDDFAKQSIVTHPRHGVDIVVAKSGLVVLQTQAAQPGADVQRLPRFAKREFGAILP